MNKLQEMHYVYSTVCSQTYYYSWFSLDNVYHIASIGIVLFGN